jgi:hypothetical protein
MQLLLENERNVRRRTPIGRRRDPSKRRKK